MNDSKNKRRRGRPERIDFYVSEEILNKFNQIQIIEVEDYSKTEVLEKLTNIIFLFQKKTLMVINIMTWTWTLTKIGVGIGLGTISNNPVGWAIGIPTSELIKLKSKDNLNSSTLTFSEKETAQRWIEISKDYQVGCAFGIAGKGLGIIASEISNSTLKLGRDASKEIAKNGFQTEVARTLITRGQNLSKIETIIKSVPNLHKLEEKIKGFINFTKELSLSIPQEEFIETSNFLIRTQNLFITEIESNLNKEKNLLNQVKENILELNQKNVNFFIKYEKSKEEHCRINKEINQILTRIKTIQLNLHNNNNCCRSCRFCH